MFNLIDWLYLIDVFCKLKVQERSNVLKKSFHKTVSIPFYCFYSLILMNCVNFKTRNVVTINTNLVWNLHKMFCFPKWTEKRIEDSSWGKWRMIQRACEPSSTLQWPGCSHRSPSQPPKQSIHQHQNKTKIYSAT